MKYDYLVFIGRFQPFHEGHQRVVDRALSLSKKVILLLGSSNVARSPRNPWTFIERVDMIASVYPEEVAAGRIVMRPLGDFTYNDTEWVAQTQQIVNAVISDIPGNTKNVTLHGLSSVKIGLIGCNKDHSSYYLKLFPTWGSEAVVFLNPINATDIREAYFRRSSKIDGDLVPEEIYNFLERWWDTDAFETIKKEVAFLEEYKKQWADSPYAPTFVTVDAVVVQSGHILLVRRGAQPGKDQLALPGGFLDGHELIEDAVLRELREETGLKVPEPVLRGSIVDRKVFDHPERSSRGRTITHAHLIKLADQTSLPKVKGGDDAAAAFWMPLAEVRETPNLFFEDHWFMIQNLVSEL